MKGFPFVIVLLCLVNLPLKVQTNQPWSQEKAWD